MAILATTYKFIVKHGFVPKIIRGLPLLSLFCALAGIAWLAILPMDGQFRRTYISENALMPSQAYSYFRESEWNILRGYRTQIEGFNVSDVGTNMLTMKSWFEDIGYKADIHVSEHGENLYAVFHAPRGDDTEAIVLGAAYFNAEGEFNVGGMALALSMARYFHRWIVWSKNIIIVIPQEPNVALREWVHAYHTSLDLTGGSIEAAVMMDYPSNSDNFQYVELYYDGINGQLPNLDLVNVAVSVSEHEGPRISIQGTQSEELETRDYWSRLRVLTRGIFENAIAGIKKGHGNEAFSGWRIQAITLKARECGSDGAHDVTVFGRIPEAIFRSVNNLLEKFHQSFFFYLLLAPREFVSIGTYLPSAAVFAVSFILSSLNQIFNSSFEISHFKSFTVQASIFFGSTIGVGFIIALICPYLPVVCNYGLIALYSSISLGSLFKKFDLPNELIPLLRSFAFLYFSTVLSSLLVLNFSLTFTIGLLALPLTFVNRFRLVNVIILLITNPFILSWALAFVEFDGQLFAVFTGLVESWKDLNCYTWFIITIGWLPTWSTIAFTTYIEDSTRTKTDPKKVN